MRMHKHADIGPSHKRKFGYGLTNLDRIYCGKLQVHKSYNKLPSQSSISSETRKGQSHLSLASYIRANKNIS